MTKEQMRKEIAQLNGKIEREVKDLADLANWMLSQQHIPESFILYSPSRLIGEHELEIQKCIARRDTLREILGEE